MPAKPNKTAPRVGAERARQALQSRGLGAMRDLTPERLARALEAFDLGYLRDATLIWQKVRDRDDTANPVIEKRELDAALLDWDILPLDDSPEAATDKAALEAAYNGLTATDALDQQKRGGVSLLVQQMMHSTGHKYAAHELVWQPAAPELTAEFRFTPLQFFENTTGRLRFLPTDHALHGDDLEEGGWMVTCGPGLMEATSIARLFKQMPLKAWLVFCDKAGMPGLHGETDAAPGSEEWEKFRDALAAFGEDWALVTSRNTKITPLDLKAGGQLPHPPLVERMDRAIARIWRGADLGTMSQQGDATGSNPQQSETDIFAAADAKRISETLNYYFDRWVIRYRYGREPRAYFQLKPRTKVNLELELKIDTALIGWGVPVGQNDLRERYQRAAPDAGDELASAPAAPSPFGAPGAMPFANEAAGREAILKANAVAAELAQRRPIFRPVAERLAALAAVLDQPAEVARLAAANRADAATLYRGVIAQAPELARAAEAALGAAVASGMAEQAAQTRLSK